MIPVVDFSAWSLDLDPVPDQTAEGLGRSLEEAFTQVGFVFLENTGIRQDEVDQVMDVSLKFFHQPEDQKKPFSRKTFSNNLNHGWVSMETERLNPRRPGDLKEAFNVSSFHPDIKWPSSADLTSFQQIQTSFFNRCKDLSLRVLTVMARSLDLDPEVFLNAHHLIGTDANGSTLRSLFYPPVNCDRVKDGQLRCGEHSDYGSITLLFQGSEGLQVRSRSGEFLCVPTIPGAVLVNIADLMQRWTGDRFISVVHRVLLPPAGTSRTRQSLAFFVQPDDGALICCCDGSDKYPPVLSSDYLNDRFNDSYGRS